MKKKEQDIFHLIWPLRTNSRWFQSESLENVIAKS